MLPFVSPFFILSTTQANKYVQHITWPYEQENMLLYLILNLLCEVWLRSKYTTRKGHRLDVRCAFHWLGASLSSSCIKSVGFIKLHQACWLHQVASSLLASPSCIKPVGFTKLHQACWLHQVASSLLASSSCIKPVGFIKLHQACWLHQVASSLLASSSCIKPVGFIKLHQACWLHQVASSLLVSSS